MISRPYDLSRRALLSGSAKAAAAIYLGSLLPGQVSAQEAQSFPNSSGRDKPRLHAPLHACDAHIHIVDSRFAPASPATTPVVGMSASDYKAIQARLGTQRVVIVQPKYYGTDNTCTLDAVAQFNGQARGIGVVHPQVPEDTLRQMHAGGIRGLRFSLWNAKDTVTTIDMLEPLAPRMKQLGWHAQLHMSGDQIVEHADLLNRLDIPLVFDHMGRLPPAAGVRHPAFKIINRLVDADRAWVKLAGAYLNTAATDGLYKDATEVARAFVQTAPERVVWGSDWPHVTEAHKPDDAVLFDLLAYWAPDDAARTKILVDNPALLYGFRRVESAAFLTGKVGSRHA
jgi:predicted TIM-barrel fold metal-dependent hydrolase